MGTCAKGASMRLSSAATSRLLPLACMACLALVACLHEEAADDGHTSGPVTDKDRGPCTGEYYEAARHRSDKNPGGKELDLAEVTIPTEIPAKSLIAQSVYSGNAVIRGQDCPTEASDSVCTEEREHSHYWMTRLPVATALAYLPPTSVATLDRIQLVPAIQGDDDGHS